MNYDLDRKLKDLECQLNAGQISRYEFNRRYFTLLNNGNKNNNELPILRRHY